jgi:purine nucleosidase
MGGLADRGNLTAAAEFTIFADPEAAAMISSGVPIHLLGLNLTSQVEVRREHADTLRALGTEWAEVLADHLDFYLRIRGSDRSAPMPFHDPVTAVYLARPALFTEVVCSVQIKLGGTLTRGMTVCEFRANRASPNGQVATAANGPAVTAHLMAELRTFCLDGPLPTERHAIQLACGVLIHAADPDRADAQPDSHNHR